MAVAMLASGRDDGGRRQLLRAIAKGAVTTAGHAEWDSRAARVERAVRAHQMRYDEHLGGKLDKFAWLMSERNRFGLPVAGRDPQEEDGASSEGAPGENQ